MSLALGCIADDYTGASDLANTLSRCGLGTVQTIGIPAADLPLPPVDAVVVSLKIRSVTAADAVAQARAAHAWLTGRGAPHVMYKICSTFDSTDAGNIGPVLDALQDDTGERIVLVTPAFPETARTVYMGNLFVGSVPLNESALKDHPLNPMRDANLVRVLERQSRGSVRLVPLSAVAGGPDAVRARLAELGPQNTAVIADAVFERDLETIGAVALEGRVSIGASGLGLGLARQLVAAGRVGAGQGRTEEARVGGLAACLAGSCSEATLGQIAAAERVMPVLRLDGGRILADSAGELTRTVEWAGSRIGSGPVLISTSARPAEVASLQSRHGREAAGSALEAFMADLAAEIVARGVRRLVVAGGETSGAVVDRLGIPAFRLGVQIAPGVPVLRTIGGADMLLALKSGNFGGPDFFEAALRLMR